jgi:putative ABC transport system permease protein
MSKWLQNFAYRVRVGWWMFILASLTTLIIFFLTMSWQTIKAARANPVESLRYE